MAVYRKKLVDKDGNTIIPAIGDIYGPVYTASLQSASGGIATYTFTPDTPVEANRVYAVKFPTPTVNNATILLGDGNITASSILLPPTYATDSPSYEIAYTYNINDSEPWLLMYNGSNQWVCLNQKHSAPAVSYRKAANGNQSMTNAWADIASLGSFSYTSKTGRVGVFMSVTYATGSTQSGMVNIGVKVDSGNVSVLGTDDWYPLNSSKRIVGMCFLDVTPNTAVTIHPMITAPTNFSIRAYQYHSINVWDV